MNKLFPRNDFHVARFTATLPFIYLTIFVLRNVYAARPGLVPEVFEEIASKAKTMQTHEKFVSLSIDEMKSN